MMAGQFEILRDVFWSPSRAVKKASEEKSLWVVRGFVLVLAGLSTALANDFMLQVVVMNASSYTTARSLASMIPTAGYIAVGVAVVAQIFSWYVTAAILLFINSLMSCAEVPYRKYLSLAVLGSIFANLAPFHLLIVWHARGAESFGSIRELFVPMGLNLLPIRMSPVVWHLLGYFNPYELSSIAFIAYGFSTLTRVPAKSGYATLVGLWFVWTLIRAVIFKTS